MPKVVVVTAVIDKKKKEATFSESLFVVEPGDTVRWNLRTRGARGLKLGASRPRVKFMTLPPQARRSGQPLLKGGVKQGKIFEAEDDVISGVVSGRAPKGGRYGYVIELVEGRQTTELKCFWKPARAARQPVVMVGGERGGGPGRKKP